MEKTQLKLKYNITFYKWAITIFFLLCNIAWVGLNSGSDLFIISWGIAVNCLSILTFTLMSIFPKLYYVIDENGVSLQNKYGKEKEYVAWNSAESIYYVYTCWLVPESMRIERLDCGNRKIFSLSISPKQARLIYETFPEVKEIIKKSGNLSSF